MSHGKAGTPEHMAWLKTQLPEMSENPNIRSMELARHCIAALPPDDLKTLRAIINGKLGKRAITPEQQKMMREAKSAKKALECLSVTRAK